MKKQKEVQQVVPQIMKLLDGLTVSYASAVLNEALRLLPNASVVSLKNGAVPPEHRHLP